MEKYFNKNLKPIFNYDLAECNQLFKKGIRAIGCGFGTRDGSPYIVFMADKRYFDAVREINGEV